MHSATYLPVLVLVFALSFFAPTNAHRHTLRASTQPVMSELFDPNWLTCDACTLIADIMANGTRDHTEKEVLEGLVFDVINALKIPQVDQNVSRGVAHTYVPVFMYVWGQKSFTVGEFCYRLNLCNKPTGAPSMAPSNGMPFFDLLERRASASDISRLLTSQHRPRKLGPAVGKFLQINDVHLQMDYRIGANTQCGEPVCCRNSNGMGTNTSNSASPLGDYNCDTPVLHYRMMLEAAAALGPFDFIAAPGDMASNEIWAQNKDYNRLAISVVSEMLGASLPGVPVFNTFGNHDAYPVNCRKGGEGDLWINQFSADIWGHWISDEAYTTLSEKGFYHTLIKPGLRFIALNSDFSNGENFYALLWDESYDTNGQIAWLKQTLIDARAANEKVLIGAHIPFINNTYDPQITALLMANEDIIMAIIHGHTHDDEFTVQCGKLLRLTNPCGTALGGTNTGFRVFHYDADFNIVDYDQYAADLAAGIKAGKLTWTKSYSALSFYNLTDMSAASWLGLVQRFKDDDALFQSWFFMYTTRMGGTCTGACKTAALAAMETCF